MAMNKNYSWMAIKYIKLLQFRITLALKNIKRNIIVSIKAKKTLIQRSIFLKLPINLVKPLVTSFRLAYIKITKKVVAQVLITQAASKALGLNKINFQMLQII